MTAPSLIFEVGYGSTWQTEPGAITWVDETARVNDRRKMIEIVRGASSARGEIDTGTLSLTLNNADRRFDPTHAAGPLFGQLVPGVPVRVRASIGGDSYGDLYEDTYEMAVTVELWSGTVASWPQRYDRGNTWATVPLQCFDRFDKLSRAKIPRSVMASVIMPLEPIAYWPLDDPQGTRYATDVVGVNMGTVWDEPEFGEPPLAPGLGSSVLFDGVNDRIDITRSRLIPDYDHHTTMVVLRTSTEADSGTIHPLYFEANGTGEPSPSVLHLSIDPVGKIEYTYVTNGIGGSVLSDAAVNDGVTHLIIAQGDIGGSDYGVAVDSAELVQVANLAGPASAIGVAIGGPPNAARGYDDNYYVGHMSNLAIWDRTLTLAERELLVGAYLALEGQTSDERIAWILDEIGWPTGFRSLSTGRSVLGPATFKPGDGALQYLRLIEDTEDGRLFVGPDGSLVFHDRYWRYLAPQASISQFTFTDQDGAQGYAEFQLDLDDELLVNVARFSRRDGAEQVATDTASVAIYGEAEEQRNNLLSTTDAQVRSLAEWAVATKSTPLPRVPKIRIGLHRYSVTDQETVLGLDLGHRVTVNRTPQGVGDPISLDFIVEGVRHEVAYGQWWVDLFVSPVPQDTAELFLLGSSTLGGTHILAH